MRCTVIGCWGGCCRVNEACSAYLLSCQGEHLLLDCGSGAASMLQNALPLQELHHVLLSHYHYDHCSDAGALSYGRLIQMQTGAAQQPLHFYGLPVEPYFERLTMEPYTYAQTIGADDTSAPTFPVAGRRFRNCTDRTSYWTACARSSARSVLAHWKTVLVHRRTLCIFSGLGWQGTPSLM